MFSDWKKEKEILVDYKKKKELSDQKSSKYSIIMEVKKKEKIQEESIKWSKEIWRRGLIKPGLGLERNKKYMRKPFKHS